MTTPFVHKPLLRVLAGERESIPPLWLMRQAGRYLPEYRALREKAAGFLDLCFDARRAAEITLQPIRRFGFDAAILFSDILVVPYALGQRVTFVEGEGPRLDALKDPAALQKLRAAVDHAALEPVYETIGRVRQDLSPAVTFLGFCGAPWTLATYMIAGQGTPDQLPARLFAYRHAEAFAKLIELLVDASASYLVRQFAAGVDAVQIFDTWAETFPPRSSRDGASSRMRGSSKRSAPRIREHASSAFRAAPALSSAAISTRLQSMRSGLIGRSSLSLRGRWSRRSGRFKAISIRWPCLPANSIGPLDRHNSCRFLSGPIYFQSWPWRAAGNAVKPRRAARRTRAPRA